MRILVIDDEMDVTLVVGDALRDRGHEVAIAASGHQALEVACAFQPDAVLLDVGLPDIDGVTLAELVRGSINRRVCVVAFSGHDEARIRPAVRRDVFDGYLMKPASLDDIERALSEPLPPRPAASP